MRVGVEHAERYLGDFGFVGDDLAALCARINVVFAKQHTPDGVHRPLPVCVSRHSAAQSINDSTWTAVQFDTNTIDTHSLRNIGVASPASAQIEDAGIYLFYASIWFAANATGYRRARWVYDDGVTLIGQVGNVIGSATAAVTVPTFAVARVTTNTRVRVEVWQNSGGALNIGSATDEERNQAVILRIPWAV